MRITLKKIILFLIIVQLFTIFLYWLWSSSSSLSSSSSSSIDQPSIQDEQEIITEHVVIVDIWSKAAIGDYLWQHILEAEIDKNIGDGYFRFGQRMMTDNIRFQFRSGFSVDPIAFEQFVHKSWIDNAKNQSINVLLVLNGRSKEKIAISLVWLQSIQKLIKQQPPFGRSLRLALLVLGHENCFNSWLKPFLVSQGGFVRALFIVYDWEEVDDQEIFQWPLGVATYRGFPRIHFNKDLVRNRRPFLCNFVGTVYPNTSRTELLRLWKNRKWDDVCHFNVRHEWQPTESSRTLNDYMNAIRMSDITLNPLGMNHECYRIYEAFSFGSTVIVEQNLNHVQQGQSGQTKSKCDQNQTLRLLHQHQAPVTFISNWTRDLPAILDGQQNLSEMDRMQRRMQVANWYSTFKRKMKEKLIQVLKEKFEI